MYWDKAIYGILSQSAAVTAIVENRIFPLVAQQATATPLIIYNLAFNTPKDTKTSYNDLEVFNIQIKLYSKDFTGLNELKEAVKTALERYQGIINGVIVHNCYFLDESTSYEEQEEEFVIMLRFDLWLKQYTYYYVVDENEDRVIDRNGGYVVATNF